LKRSAAAAPAAPEAAAHIATSSAYDGLWMPKPPSTGIVAPVMAAAASDARKTIVAATSSGRASPGVSVCRIIISMIGGGTFCSTVDVVVRPGMTVTLRMPILPYCVATLRVKPMTAALDVPYAGRTSSPCIPAPDAVLITTPPPRWSMLGTAYFVQSM
jgi:hypothetical protein